MIRGLQTPPGPFTAPTIRESLAVGTNIENLKSRSEKKNEKMIAKKKNKKRKKRKEKKKEKKGSNRRAAEYSIHNGRKGQRGESPNLQGGELSGLPLIFCSTAVFWCERRRTVLRSVP